MSLGEELRNIDDTKLKIVTISVVRKVLLDDLHISSEMLAATAENYPSLDTLVTALQPIPEKVRPLPNDPQSAYEIGMGLVVLSLAEYASTEDLRIQFPGLYK